MRRTVLALLVVFAMTAASPAAAAQGPILDLEGVWAWLIGLWSSDQERGLGIDPDGLTTSNERGLEIDPNGLTVDRGPELDPDGATWCDRGAGIDPNGLTSGERGLGLDPNG